MNIKPLNYTSFGIRIKIDKAQKLQKAVNDIYNATPDQIKASSGTISLSSTSAGVIGIPATNTVATGVDVLGTAFSAKAAGINSYGIVPSALAKMTPYLTPATIESSGMHPETAGSIFSTLGSQLHSHARIKMTQTTKKIPS